MVDNSIRGRRRLTEEERQRNAQRTQARLNTPEGQPIDDIPALPGSSAARAENYGRLARQERRRATPIRTALRDTREAAQDFLDPRRAENAGPGNLFNSLAGVPGALNSGSGIRATQRTVGRVANVLTSRVPAPITTTTTALGGTAAVVANATLPGDDEEDAQSLRDRGGIPEVPGGRVLPPDRTDLSGVTGTDGDFIQGNGIQEQTAGPFAEGFYGDFGGRRAEPPAGERQSIRDRNTLPIGQSARNQVLEAYGIRGVGRGALAGIVARNTIRREGRQGEFSTALNQATQTDNERLRTLNNRNEERRQFDATLGETQRQFDVQTLQTLNEAQKETGLPPEQFDELVGGALNNFEQYTGIQSQDPEVRGQMRERMAERFGNYTRRAQSYLQEQFGDRLTPQILRREQQNLIDGFSAVEALAVSAGRSARETSTAEGIFRPGTVGENQTQALFNADSPEQVRNIIQQFGQGLAELERAGGGITLPGVGGNSLTGFETSESGRSTRRNTSPGFGQTQLINLNVGGQTQVVDASELNPQLRQRIQSLYRDWFTEDTAN